jgi:hypothetical protein
MESTLSKTDDSWTGRRIDFEAFSVALSERRAETGITDLPRNNGRRRTTSKKAMLAAIEAAGGKW